MTDGGRRDGGGCAGSCLRGNDGGEGARGCSGFFDWADSGGFFGWSYLVEALGGVRVCSGCDRGGWPGLWDVAEWVPACAGMTVGASQE